MFSVTYKKIFLYIAAALMLGSLAIIGLLGVRFGIDFTGGSLLEVSYTEAPAKDALESAVAELNWGGVSVREAGNEADERTAYLIRTRDLTEAERVTLEEVATALGSEGSVERFTTVGPVIGEELKDKAVWAIAAVSIIIMLYVAYAFAGIGKPVSSWVYGGITIFILIHDIVIPTAIMSILGYTLGAEIDVLFVMALLAVLGYSVNDTIVVFDRVRDNLIANRTEARTQVTKPGGIVEEDIEYTLTKPFPEIVGSAVTQSMARSINTSFTTIIVLMALFFLGGTLTQTFALVLLAGVLAGTYSSICIASPMLVAYAEYLERKEAAAVKTTEA